LLQILAEASSKNLSIGKTQLVKMLYLVEVEHYRQTGERLTDLKWKFYYYGPYAHELEAVLAEPEFSQETKQTRDEKTFIQIKVAEPPRAYGSFVEAKTGLLVKRVVGQWGNKPLGEVLDYVYFETEPMQCVERRGDYLDFATIKRDAPKPVIPLKASAKAEERMRELRARLAPFFESMGRRKQTQETLSDDYRTALETWDEEESQGKKDFSNLTVRISKPSDEIGNEGN
jgi:hypothetical protein